MPDPRNFNADDISYNEDELNLSGEELDAQVQRAQDQISELRRRQEQIEKEKLHLEELSRKQEQLEKGRTELIEKLQRALNQLKREELDAQKRLEEVGKIDESFADYLKELQSISPKSWASSELEKNLTSGLASLDEASTAYSKLLPRVSEELVESTLQSVEDEEGGVGSERTFVTWFIAGLAFTLPLLIFGVIALIILFIKLTPIH